jgi:hypothetical protein
MALVTAVEKISQMQLQARLIEVVAVEETAEL